MPTRRLVLVATALLVPKADAHSFKLGGIAIGHAWALPSQQADGQLFFPLVNNGAEPDALLSARSGACASIELRRNDRYGDPPETGFQLEPGKPLPMRPTARHLRLVGLNAPLERGGRFRVIVGFRLAGEIEIEAEVAETANG